MQKSQNVTALKNCFVQSLRAVTKYSLKCHKKHGVVTQSLILSQTSLRAAGRAGSAEKNTQAGLKDD